MAASGEEALGRIERGARVDLLFTDLVMPGGMNGLVLAERARQRLPQLPVLLTTGYTEELVNRQASSSSLAVLGKPYRRTELLDRVRAALGRAELSGPGRAQPLHAG